MSRPERSTKSSTPAASVRRCRPWGASRSLPSLTEALRSTACSSGLSPAIARQRRLGHGCAAAAIGKRGSSITRKGAGVRRGWICRGMAASTALLLIGTSAVLAAEKHRPAPARSPAAKTAPAAPVPVPAPGGGFTTEAKHAIIVEAETGTVLFNKDADERMPPASMSKMMTAYVVFGLLKSGRAKLTDQLPVSAEAWKTGGSKMFVPVGGSVSIENLLQGMIVQSGNDACIVLAEGLAGSQQAFVEMMNAKAKEIGLTNSHFDDVDGLPDPNHWMTARDLATLAWRTIKDFPEYYHYYSEKDYS